MHFSTKLDGMVHPRYVLYVEQAWERHRLGAKRLCYVAVSTVSTGRLRQAQCMPRRVSERAGLAVHRQHRGATCLFHAKSHPRSGAHPRNRMQVDASALQLPRPVGVWDVELGWAVTRSQRFLAAG